jgi:cystathionine beta-synthase
MSQTHTASQSVTRRKVFQNVIHAIGDTPIVRLNRVAPKELTEQLGIEFYAKLEYMNPGGSIKDRIGWWLIEDAEKRGVLKPGGTIVESTSGNTGVGLAIASAIKGYKCVFVLPDKMSQEKIKNLRAFGAKVIVTPTAVEPEDPRSYYSVSRRMGSEIPGAYYMNQYDNLANRACHYATTGPEILDQMPDLDVFVAGIGTGGTICGVGKYLREKKPQTEVVAIDPVGSIVYEMYKTGSAKTRPKTYKIEGIGEDFIPKNYDFSVITDMGQVDDKSAFLMTRELLTKEGLYCGISCGAAVAGAFEWAKSQGERLRGKKILIVLPDSGNRYMSKVYDDDWMREAGFLDTPSLGSIADLLASVRPSGSEVITAKKTDKVSSVIDLMHQKGISQLPIVDSQGWVQGIVTEGALLSALYEKKAGAGDAVEKLVTGTVEFVLPTDSIEKVSKLITDGKTPLVVDSHTSGKMLAILTKIDLLTFLNHRS